MHSDAQSQAAFYVLRSPCKKSLLPSFHWLWAQVMRTFGGMGLLDATKKEKLKMKKRFLTGLATGLFMFSALATTPAHASLVSTFDTGSEGWYVEGSVENFQAVRVAFTVFCQ